MTDRIPEEIMQEAMRIARDIECTPSDGNLRIIADALLRERQRAAEIAGKHRPSWLSPNTEHLQRQADSIANAILSDDEAQK